MHKKYHEKFKILGILAVTTQAREGIETLTQIKIDSDWVVTTQAREGIETFLHDKPSLNESRNNSSPRGH